MSVCLCVCARAQDAFSLLAYSDPWNCPVGQQLDPTQRESLCSALNSAILGKNCALHTHTHTQCRSVAPAERRAMNAVTSSSRCESDVRLVPFLCSRVPKSAQAATANVSAGPGDRVHPAHGPGSLGVLLLCQSRQLFALAQFQGEFILNEQSMLPVFCSSSRQKFDPANVL